MSRLWPDAQTSGPLPFAGATVQRDASRVIRGAGIPASTAFALAAFSGVIEAATFLPWSSSSLAWAALVPLLVACASLPPRRAALAGMLWTAALGAGVAWCLPAMLSRFLGLATIGSWSATAAIVLLHGIWVGGYAAWVAWLVRRGAANPVLLAGGWLACEYASANAFLGSPWVLTAYSQVQQTALIQSADLAGPYGIGLLIAAVNAAVAACLVPALRGTRPSLAAAAIAASLAIALLYGYWRLGQSFGEGPAVDVAVVQGGASPAERSERQARLDRYVSLTSAAARARPGLVVWPEYAVEAYLEEASGTRDAVVRAARDAHADLVLGGPHYTPSPSGTRYHNSAYLVRDGRVAARYDKHRLVPFAEDGRLEWLFGRRSTPYSAGLGPAVLPASDLHIGAMLCVESMFPEAAREAVRGGADVLVNLSNDAWFGDAEPARHQLEIASLRAVETRRFLVRAAATGFSAVIDPHGRALVQSDFDAHQVLHATVRAAHTRTLYQRWGDAFAWSVITAVALATLRPFLARALRQKLRRSS